MLSSNEQAPLLFFPKVKQLCCLCVAISSIMSYEYQVWILKLWTKPEGFVYPEKFTARTTTVFMDMLIPSIPIGNYSSTVKLVSKFSYLDRPRHLKKHC